MSSGSLYYRDPDPEIGQGDIFGGIPHAYVRKPLQVVQVIENNQNYTRFFLPADERIPEPSYVDFRRISCVHADFLSGDSRVTRVSEVLMGGLFRQFFLFLTHRRLTDDALFGTPDAG